MALALLITRRRGHRSRRALPPLAVSLLSSEVSAVVSLSRGVYFTLQDHMLCLDTAATSLVPPRDSPFVLCCHVVVHWALM